MSPTELSKPRKEDGLLQLYFKRINTIKPLSSEREATLSEEISKGNHKAKEELITANLRFVVSVARNYENRGLPIKDLINEGNIGLIRAAERFDSKKNFKFISYAVWWIRQAILQALADHSRFVRIPLNKVPHLSHIRKVAEKFEQKHGRPPTNHELLEESDIESFQDLDTLLNIEQPPLSVYTQMADKDKSTELINILKDNTVESPDEVIEELSLKQTVGKFLGCLRERERQILTAYYGLDGGHPHTLEEIGIQLEITRERVRQIKDKVLKELRNKVNKIKVEKSVIY